MTDSFPHTRGGVPSVPLAEMAQFAVFPTRVGVYRVR